MSPYLALIIPTPSLWPSKAADGDFVRLVSSASITGNYHMNNGCGGSTLCAIAENLMDKMDYPHSSLMDRPAIYRIQVYGPVSERWVSGYWDMSTRIVQHRLETHTTEMIGEVLDQAALVGLINIFYDLGHAIISVERLTADQMNEITKE